MTWLALLINAIVPIVVKLIEVIPHYWNRKGKEAKFVKKGKQKSIDYLEKFRNMTVAEIAKYNK